MNKYFKTRQDKKGSVITYYSGKRHMLAARVDLYKWLTALLEDFAILKNHKV